MGYTTVAPFSQYHQEVAPLRAIFSPDGLLSVSEEKKWFCVAHELGFSDELLTPNLIFLSVSHPNLLIHISALKLHFQSTLYLPSNLFVTQ